MLTITCACGEVFHADAQFIGKKFKCRSCGAVMEIAPQRESRGGAKPRPSFLSVPQASRRPDRDPSAAPSGGSSLWKAGAIIAGTLALGSLMLWTTADSNGPSEPYFSGAGAYGSSNYAVDGGVPAIDPAQIRLAACLDSAEAQPYSRSGDERPGGSRGGDHKMTVSNGTSDDALVVLKPHSGRRARVMYVRAGEVGRFTGVREGTYTVQTAYGDGFRRDRFGFCLTHSFGQFDRVAEFYRSYADGMTYTSAHTLTLHKVADGNVRQQALDSASFAASLAAGGM